MLNFVLFNEGTILYYDIYHHMSLKSSTSEISMIISLLRTIMTENWKVGWPTTEVCLK